jgi:SAM-dependent methyltransferase
MRIGGTKDIKHFVKSYIQRHRADLAGKLVVDIPAGSGYSSEILHQTGAIVEAFDLFPEFFKYDGVKCRKADLEVNLPIESSHADIVLFQEGIEHLSDQLHALGEINRILKPNGKLLLTTPNYSSLKAKMSYLLNESESYMFMPPNQLESIWFTTGEDTDDRFYFGHAFLIGIQRLKLFATLPGFKLLRLHHTRVNLTSFFIMLFFYPLVLLSSYRAYRRAVRKNESIPTPVKKKAFWEILKLQVNPKVLIDAHLFVEFQKYCELDEVAQKTNLYRKHQATDFQT